LLIVVLFFNSVVTIDAGDVGILLLFGRVTGERLEAGLHFINPFKTVKKMVIRTQSIKESASVPSSEGLVINLDTSLVFHLNPDKAADVYSKLGLNYIDVIVEPNLRSLIREATASHSANTLYSSAREEVASQIRESLKAQLQPRGIEVEEIL